MNLNHLGLGVTEVLKTVAMFEKYFGLRPVKYSPANDKMAFLNGDGGALIAIILVPDVNYPKIFHIGFMQDSLTEVHTLHEQLSKDGSTRSYEGGVRTQEPSTSKRLAASP